ncbi:MAG: hypothetical protein RL189_1526 [Pseudomonadota bacterium]|jgi:hypothetical protein
MAEFHSEVSSRELRMDRRQLLKWTAAALAVGKFMNTEAALAAGECTAIGNLVDLPEGLKDVPRLTKDNSSIAAKDFLYWIDGPMNMALSGYNGNLGQNRALETRARLSCTMHVKHSSASYIETVILTDANDNIIAQQYFDANSRLPEGGFAPYVIFENLALEKQTYKVFFVQNNGDKPAVVFEHVIKDAQPSRFDYEHLSPQARAEHILSILTDELNDVTPQTANIKTSVNYRFEKWLANEVRSNETAGTGFVTTPYGTWQDSVHTARARINQIYIDADNRGDFEIVVDFMHGDGDDAHYMRYFLVLDPVGRVLGAVRRISSGDSLSNQRVLIRKGFWTPVKTEVYNNLSAGEKSYCYGHRLSTDAMVKGDAAIKESGVIPYARMHVRHTGTGAAQKVDESVLEKGFWLPADVNDAKYRQLNQVNIINCPHIQILTDDKFHAIARACIKLR